MNQIQMLWKLQNHDLRLKKLKEDLNEIYKRKESEDLKIEINQKKYDLTNKKTLIEVNNVKIQRNNNKLKQLNFNVEEKEIKLYDGSITDLKQLTHLNEEVEEVKKQIEDYETSLLELMEEVESLKVEVGNLEFEYNERKKKLKSVINDENDRIDCFKSEIKNEQNEIDNLIISIEKDLLEKYNKLKQTKGKAIVEVIDDKCTGCNMVIPTLLSSKLKSSREIVQCDNCNRILYYNEGSNEKSSI